MSDNARLSFVLSVRQAVRFRAKSIARSAPLGYASAMTADADSAAQTLFDFASMPHWARPREPVGDATAAAFLSGSALNSLDNLIRSDQPWAGAWRRRLALKCAAAAARLAGRPEEEGALRDSFAMTRPGDDAGPGGRILLAWRQLAAPFWRPLDADALRGVADQLGQPWHDRFGEVAEEQTATVWSRAAPAAAAATAARVVAIAPDAEILAFWLADWTLAKHLRWPAPLPLLIGQVHKPVFRAGGARNRRIRPGDDPFEAFERAVFLAYAQAAVEAWLLASRLAGRAARLIAVAPRLRAKGAADVVQRLLDDESLSASWRGPGGKMSRWALRRLFERLIELDAVRELSGRDTFKIFGL